MINRNPRGVAVFSVVAVVLALTILVQTYLLANAPKTSGEPEGQEISTEASTAEPQAVVEAPTPTHTATPVPTATPTPRPEPTATVAPTATPAPIYSGALKSSFDYQPVAVMIDNFYEARPHSGLTHADVVYEALVEGGITRLMAIFANADSEVVGPVRSGRHYFMYWASEYDAVYVLAGASPQGYEAAREIDLPMVDYTYGQGFFWRSRERYAPHNLYTDIGRLRQTFKDTGEGRLGSLKFKDESPEAQVTSITLTHPDKYQVSYSYREEDNSYARTMARAPHVDAYVGEQYHPKNVVVQIVSAWPIRGDTAGRMDMDLVGNGPAYFFLDGKAVEGTWHKDSLTSPTRFLDTDGAEVLFNAGQTWIQVAPTNSTLKYE